MDFAPEVARKSLSLIHRDRRPRSHHLATALGGKGVRLIPRHVIVSMKMENLIETKAVPLVELKKFVKIL